MKKKNSLCVRNELLNKINSTLFEKKQAFIKSTLLQKKKKTRNVKQYLNKGYVTLSHRRIEALRFCFIFLKNFKLKWKKKVPLKFDFHFFPINKLWKNYYSL